MKKLKVMTVIGTRPEIIRLSRVMAKLDEYCDHVLVHTGQNYDYELNEIFFADLGIRKPDRFLEAAGGTGAETIGKVIIAADRILERDPARSRAGSGRHQQLPRGDPGQAPQRSRSSTWRPAIAASTCACRKRSTAGSSTIRPTSTSTYSDHRARVSAGAKDCRRIASSRPGSPMREVLEHHRVKIASSDVLARLGLEPRRLLRGQCAPRGEHRVGRQPRVSSGRCSTPWPRRYGLPVIVSTHPRTQKRIDTTGLQARRAGASGKTPRLH